jgi:uncharacterized protein (DUF2236 family)
MLPTDEELASIVLTPASLAWRRASDLRLFMGAGYALLMQVAHPTVGAGVREHSSYATDPMGRLVRTLDYVNVLVYGGLDAASRAGERLRDLHKRIQGTLPDGRRYHALEPGAFAWVHATLLESIVSGHELFGRPFTAEERDRFYVEFKRLGRIHGIRDRDLPDDWSTFEQYFDDMVENHLENNDTVQDLLRFWRAPRFRAWWMPQPLWKVLRVPVSHVAMMGSAGMLPPVLRERFGVRWTGVNQAELRAFGAVSRATTPLLPRGARINGPRYLELRRRAEARRAARLLASA